MSAIGPFGYRGGINAASSYINFPPNQMLSANDVVFNYNSLQRRPGSSLICQAGANSVGRQIFQLTSSLIFRYLDNSGPTDRIAFSTNLSGTLTTITDSSTGGLSNFMDYTVLNNLAIWAKTNNTKLIKWSGSGNIQDLGGTPPTGTAVKVANNFLFIAGGDNYTLNWSDAGNPESWPAGNNVAISKNDGDVFAAIVPFQGNIIYSKQNSIWSLSTLNPTTIGTATVFAPLTNIVFGFGIASQFSWAIINQNLLCFVGSDNHVYLFDGANFLDISNPPYPASNVQSLLNADAISYHTPQVLFYSGRNQILIHGIGLANTYVYNMSYQCWESVHKGMSNNWILNYHDLTGLLPFSSILLSVGTVGTKASVYQQDTGTTYNDLPDGISSFTCQATIPVELSPSAGDYALRSGVLPVNGNSTSNAVINTQYAYDGGTLGYSTNISTNGTAGAFMRKRMSFVENNNAATLQLQFSQTNTGYDFTIHPFYLADTVIE